MEYATAFHAEQYVIMLHVCRGYDACRKIKRWQVGSKEMMCQNFGMKDLGAPKVSIQADRTKAKSKD